MHVNDAAGFCRICRRDVVFAADTDWFRDSLVCTTSGSVPRERALTIVLEWLFPGWSDLSIRCQDWTPSSSDPS